VDGVGGAEVVVGDAGRLVGTTTTVVVDAAVGARGGAGAAAQATITWYMRRAPTTRARSDKHIAQYFTWSSF
jgi:hypothetical protein